MTTQNVTPIAGVNVDVASALAPFTDMPVGTQVDIVGKRCLKVSAATTCSQYDAMVVSAAYAASQASLTTTATAFGQYVGVALATATATGQHIWVQIGGTGFVNVLANCAANVVLNSTATVGALDDDATAGSEDISGIVLTTANGGSTAAAACVITVSSVGVTN